MILGGDTQWWQMLICLFVALLLSTGIGLERQIRNKSAGMRTHALVGLGAALFVVVSKYGFSDVLAAGLVTLDPSRVAASIVSGIGFIGAGLVFVRRNKVRGLTTASSIWLTAAVGTAAGAGLILPAIFVTAAYFLVAVAYTGLTERLRFVGQRYHLLRATYVDGTGALRQILDATTRHGFQVQGFSTRRVDEESADGVIHRLLNDDTGNGAGAAMVEVELEIEGTGPTDALLHELAKVPTVSAVSFDQESE